MDSGAGDILSPAPWFPWHVPKSILAVLSADLSPSLLTVLPPLPRGHDIGLHRISATPHVECRAIGNVQ